ncbi:MAG TPA: Fic family protein [Caulobacteraceae bacterium]|nr:Fic family protein [Caulobacteraceae bacterium]
MFVHDLVGTEQHPAYQQLAAENLDRQYSFLRSVTVASLTLGQPMLSIEVVKALNYHAVSCLHASAGEFRTWPVTVGKDFQPPLHIQVAPLMQMFTNQVNRMWDEVDAVTLAAMVLWRLNFIHPFINGNGRAARAACHYVLCLKAGGWLPGDPILPELIRANRPEYVERLKAVDASAAAGALDVAPLHAFLTQLIDVQLRSAGPPPPERPPAEEPPPTDGGLPPS